jgi:hypothetical protein
VTRGRWSAAVTFIASGGEEGGGSVWRMPRGGRGGGRYAGDAEHGEGVRS